VAGDFYSRLSQIDLLLRSWHLARVDAADDFTRDPLGHSDFAFQLQDHIAAMAEALRTETYRPSPLLKIDVPKSTLSVRPGSTPIIEDRVVLFAIAQLLAPRLDRALAKNVFSYRLRRSSQGGRLFVPQSTLSIPFLKRQTIRRRLDPFQPWYESWPEFLLFLRWHYARGYKFFVSSDVASYFENIDLGLLRDLLRQYFPLQPRIVNFLCSMFGYWAWPATGAMAARRGIPQGNDVSRFIGNVYLIPLDRLMTRLARQRKIVYVRFMDDIHVLAKERRPALDALFAMNDELRGLRLNIQGAKTQLLEGREIERLFDARLERINELIELAERSPEVSQDFGKRRATLRRLDATTRVVKTTRRGVVLDRDLRLYRRLLTAYRVWHSDAMVPSALRQLRINPDSRLIESVETYLRSQAMSGRHIGRKLASTFSSGDLFFPFQEASVLAMMREARALPRATWPVAWKRSQHRRTHWYVRQQAAMLIGLRTLTRDELLVAQARIRAEPVPEVKRAWIHSVAQLARPDLQALADSLLQAVDPSLQRLGRYCRALLNRQTYQQRVLESIFREFSEDFVVPRLYEIEFLSRSASTDIKRALLDKLQTTKPSVRRPATRKRWSVLIRRLTTEFMAQRGKKQAGRTSAPRTRRGRTNSMSRRTQARGGKTSRRRVRHGIT
jgi:hypothetical protein